ncbi:TetR/AcrR family transcriptional regulator [Micromonospora sp. Llam7]|uniref:TetR/AcrR family transcriptional regulator n=1 Tax=Micromonospora tarapacensis TaxID=2835305 RepID=UPI001C83F748|nr:TetR/AcrR family transcriptional regulator [Micromonospora tarapacensis]
MTSGTDSERREELIARVLEYSATHGLSDMSLRPLATAVGSSPRVLLYYFGSKEGLIREVLARSRARQLDAVEQAANSGSDPIETLWRWLTDPGQAEIERLFFEGCVRSLHNQDGAWRDFGAASVQEWLTPMRQVVTRTGAAGNTPYAPTLVLAAIRGLLLDLLATRDQERIEGAFADLIRLLRTAPEESAGLPPRPGVTSPDAAQ